MSLWRNLTDGAKVLVLFTTGLAADVSLTSQAAAQTPGHCELPADLVASMPLESRERALRDRRPEAVWIGDGTEGPVSLRRLARMASPALWFSPQEFLMLERANGAPPPPTAVPADALLDGQRVNQRDPHERMAHVYYRIRAVRLREHDEGPQLALDAPAVLTDIRSIDRQWGCGPGPHLPLRQLDRITIRYFFYYPEDRGIGGHLHDLEALELQLRADVVCGQHQVEPGQRYALPGGQAQRCFDAIVIESAAGSAHGVGWYTNVLELSKARDTRVPLTVLVEENKHATVPDRDGDGIYMPHYDVNRYTNDAWGLRDVAGSGRLGEPDYSAEQSRLTRTLHWDHLVTPADGYWPRRLRAAFRNNEKRLTSNHDVSNGKRWQYTLKPSWTSLICDNSEVDEDAVALASSSGNGSSPRRLIDLARKLDFCEGPSGTTVRGTWWVSYQRVSDIFAAVYPGPRNQYGFMRWPQRMSLSYRRDGGHGLSYVGPFLPGTEVPVLGGWLVGRITYSAESHPRDLGRAALWALYTPSASHAVGWYAALGHEWRSLSARSDEAGSAARSATVDRSKGLVEEVGIKFRFSVEKMPVAKFWGARIGVQLEGLRPITNPRLVFEFGAGSW